MPKEAADANVLSNEASGVVKDALRPGGIGLAG